MVELFFVLVQLIRRRLAIHSMTSWVIGRRYRLTSMRRVPLRRTIIRRIVLRVHVRRHTRRVVVVVRRVGMRRVPVC